jgi:hypothetical protein
MLFSENFPYKKSVGMLCSTMPLLFYLVAVAITSTAKFGSSLAWALVNFIPLILISYFVGAICRQVSRIIHTTHIVPTFMITWAILFPIARIISDHIALITYAAPPYEQIIFPYYIAILIALGLVYGLFFTTMYIFLYKCYAYFFR